MRPLFILPGVCAVIYSSVMLVCAGVAFAIPQAKTEQQRDESPTLSASRKGSIVRGRVIYEDTRRPLRRVQVMIYDPANRRGRGRHLRSWTNARGEFQLKDVPEGKYFISVDAPGIIRSQPFDSSDPQTDLTSVTVDGTSQSDVVVRVKRGGAVSGKVTYADGDPVVNASLRILIKKEDKWVPVYVRRPSGDQELTDERGVYRVSGLSPGDYLIGAAEEKMGIELMAQEEVDGSVMLNRARFPATYYGGAVSLKGATVLRVEAGDEKADINITLVEHSVYSISGVVMLKGDQRPIARARVSLKKKDEEPDSLRGEDLVVNADEEGRFTFDEAPEGAYLMTVTPPRENYRSYTVDPPGPRTRTEPIQKFAAKNLELNVAGDVTGLVVEVSSGSRLSGVLTVEGGKQLPSAFVFLEPAAGTRREQLSTPVQSDGSFTVGGISSGAYYLRTFVQPNNEYYTKSVMHGRSDLTREPLDIKEGEDISNVRMVISADVARVSGRVLGPDGKSPEHGVSILLVPADPLEQKTMSRRMYGFTNAAGGFSLSGAPGEYLAIVVRRGESSNGLRGDKLVSRAAKAQRVVLQPGENNKIELVSEK